MNSDSNLTESLAYGERALDGVFFNLLRFNALWRGLNIVRCTVAGICVNYVSIVLVAMLSLGGEALGAPQPCRIIDPELAKGIYTGGCKNGLAEGYGKVSGPSSYSGDFHAGKKHGKGVKVMPNGDRYEGDFSDGYRHGKGVYVWGDRTPWAGDRYEGDYRRDLRDGHGVYQWSNGDRYDGSWKDDLRLGLSVMELRRAQAAEAAAKVVKPGALLCAEEKWDSVNLQLVRGRVESATGKSVNARIIEVEGGFINYRGKTLSVGDILVDEAAHWQICGQN